MVYAKEVETTNQRFKDRDIVVSSAGYSKVAAEAVGEASVIPVPDTVVLCNGCNSNLYPEKGFLVYLSKRELKEDLPYDLYCSFCLKRCFPKAIIV